VVWCGVVWCGVVWCGVVWCGVVWCGVVWCGVRDGWWWTGTRRTGDVRPGAMMDGRHVMSQAQCVLASCSCSKRRR
jgi:hypothetical protein